jgi:hypothetical protein
MLPCFHKEKIDFNTIDYKDGNLYKDELDNVAAYEFGTDLNSRIARYVPCKITLSCKTDDRENPELLGYQDAFITVSQYENAEFCLVTICIVNVKEGLLTYIIDQASRREMCISEAGQDISLHNWMKNALKLEQAGRAFFASCVSELPDVAEARSILSAEAFHKDSDYSIVSKVTEENLQENHAQYSHYDAYMSERGIIYVMKGFDENYRERLSIECIMIFIVELIVLKITAINTANETINKAYTKEEVSSNDILEILEGFAKSMPLWDTQQFRYFLAQEFANRVESSFKVSRYLEDYERSRTQLEQIVDIRKLNASEKETRIVTFFAIILAVCQITPFFQEIASSKFDGWKNTIKQNVGPFVTLIIIAAFTIWFFFGKKLKTLITQIFKDNSQ